MSKMPEEEKRTPISIYLTPRASAVLREFSMGSGYGSISRTVEEIILAFDAVYNNMRAFSQLGQVTANTQLTKEEKLKYFLVLLAIIINIDNAISRLGKETSSLQR